MFKKRRIFLKIAFEVRMTFPGRVLTINGSVIINILSCFKKEGIGFEGTGESPCPKLQGSAGHQNLYL